MIMYLVDSGGRNSLTHGLPATTPCAVLNLAHKPWGPLHVAYNSAPHKWCYSPYSPPPSPLHKITFRHFTTLVTSTHQSPLWNNQRHLCYHVIIVGFIGVTIRHVEFGHACELWLGTDECCQVWQTQTADLGACRHARPTVLCHTTLV